MPRKWPSCIRLWAPKARTRIPQYPSSILSEKKQSTLDVYRYFFAAYPGHSAMMVVLMVLAGLAEGVGLVTLFPVLELAEGGGMPDNAAGRAVVHALAFLGLEPTLAPLLTLIVLAITLKALLLLFAQKQVGFTVAKVVLDLRLSLMRALFEVRWGFFGTRTPGEFAASMTAESQRSGTAYQEACNVFSAIFQLLAYILVATLVSWWITTGVLAVALVMYFLARVYFRQSRDAGDTQTRSQRGLSSRLVDVLQGIKPLKAMGREGLVWPFLENETLKLNLAARTEVRAAATLRAFQEPILTLFLAVGLFFVLEMAAMPLASTLFMAFLFYRMAVHVNTLQMRYQIILVLQSAFFSLMRQMDEAREAREVSTGTRVVTGLSEGIRLEGVTFGYDEGPVLKNLDAFIPAGSFVAVHGESGSGKTTFADLVVGLHRPQEGRILIDGYALDDLDLGSWRRCIGYVPQELLLFSESILLNVTLGDPAYSREDAERALKLAGAWDFVTAKPGGLDHPMGDRGTMVSGGQRQRIALARALVGNPSLLILDEVTTALDPETELAICNTLQGLTAHVTILAISHQEAMRNAASQVLLLRNGRLEELRGGPRKALA